MIGDLPGADATILLFTAGALALGAWAETRRRRRLRARAVPIAALGSARVGDDVVVRGRVVAEGDAPAMRAPLTGDEVVLWRVTAWTRGRRGPTVDRARPFAIEDAGGRVVVRAAPGAFRGEGAGARALLPADAVGALPDELAEIAALGPSVGRLEQEIVALGARVVVRGRVATEAARARAGYRDAARVDVVLDAATIDLD